MTIYDFGYEIPEVTQAREELEEAQTRLIPLIRKMQRAKERAAKLEAEYLAQRAPYAKKVESAYARQKRTLGPWVEQDKQSSYRYAVGALRVRPAVWLRLARCDDHHWKWCLDIKNGELYTRRLEATYKVEAEVQADAVLREHGFCLMQEDPMRDLVEAFHESGARREK